jgi:3-hydroxymyristoyl/3-hydroxydecanoyl-(acyl carrier protein) dehydratase
MKRSVPIEVSAEHAAYAGHFPNFPVLPGAVLLDEALRLLMGEHGGVSGWQIAAAKFLSAVRPGDPLRLEYDGDGSSAIRFSIYAAERKVVSGVFAAAQVTPP